MSVLHAKDELLKRLREIRDYSPSLYSDERDSINEAICTIENDMPEAAFKRWESDESA